MTAVDCREGLRTDELRAAGVQVVLASVTGTGAGLRRTAEWYRGHPFLPPGADPA